MRILIIKTTSLGDILNTLPALTDAGKYCSAIKFDWVVEKSFAEIPTLHPLVENIIPVEIRQWRKNPWQAFRNGEWKNFYRQLRAQNYDLIIDAQGLMKSGFLAYLARGIKCGYDFHSAWELLACFAYQKRFRVEPKQHAVTRIRQLFAHSLNYSDKLNLAELPDCNINKNKLPPRAYPENYCVLLHGTARHEKCWPEDYWQKLILKLLEHQNNLNILLPWGNQTEKNRAENLAKISSRVKILPKLSLIELASILSYSEFNIAVDTGLGHLAAALDSPTISLYGPTYPELNGTLGKNQLHMKAERMTDILPAHVLTKLREKLIKP